MPVPPPPQFPSDIESLIDIIKAADNAVNHFFTSLSYEKFYTDFECLRPTIRAFLQTAYCNDYIIEQELSVLSNKFKKPSGTGYTEQYIYKAVVKSILRNSFIFLSIYAKYPGYILAPKHAEFTKNFVGGIYAEIRIIYASMSSYIALYGTCLDQTGFSGVYPKMTVNDLMISGTMNGAGYGPQQSLPVTYKMGSYSQLNPGQKWTYNMITGDGTGKYQPVYMLDVGYGEIPDAFWEGIIMPAIKDSDYKSALVQLRDDIRATIKSNSSRCVIL